MPNNYLIYEYVYRKTEQRQLTYWELQWDVKCGAYLFAEVKYFLILLACLEIEILSYFSLPLFFFNAKPQYISQVELEYMAILMLVFKVLEVQSAWASSIPCYHN